MKELNEAKVLAVGPGGLDKEGKRVTPSVAPGDKVLIPQVCLSCRGEVGIAPSLTLRLSTEEARSRSEMRNTLCSEITSELCLPKR